MSSADIQQSASGEPSGAPSVSGAPSFTRATKIMNLLLTVSSEGALVDEGSPQGKAYLWVTTTPVQLQPGAGEDDVQIIQQYILAVFYYATNGDGWTDNNGWLGSETECNWFRVDCTGGVVTKLNPYGNDLVGSIPSEVGSLDSLEYLSLSSNKLTGGIDAGICDLLDLTFLKADCTVCYDDATPDNCCTLCFFD